MDAIGSPGGRGEAARISGGNSGVQNEPRI
jgi:hypothetical protein